MTKTVEDAAIMLNAIAGFDPSDPASLDFSPPDYTLQLRKSLKGIRLGVPKNYFFEGIHPEIEKAVQVAIEKLRSLGAQILEVEIPFVEHTMAVEFTIIASEASAYHEKSLRRNAKLYDPDVRTFLELGELIPSRYYLKSQRVRGLITKALASSLNYVDLLVTPTTPVPPGRLRQTHFSFDGRRETVLHAYVRTCCPFNLAGLPAISIPCGFTRNKLPIGLQIAGKAFDERRVLQVAHAYESATGWHLMNPPMQGAS
jgi:aspartyl-tRNA(Asn)/glutamyl-tRNA(Gln) amidotransferase subunit A